jgi:hypothetical protein
LVIFYLVLCYKWRELFQTRYVPGGIGGDEAGVVDQGEEGGLQQLHHNQRTGYPHQRDPGEAHAPCITPERCGHCCTNH